MDTQKQLRAGYICTCVLQGDPHKYQTFLQTRPKRFEAAAVSMLIDVLRTGQKQGFEEGFELHIAHLGNADILPLIKAAKADGECCRMCNSHCLCCLGGAANSAQGACCFCRCMQKVPRLLVLSWPGTGHNFGIVDR